MIPPSDRTPVFGHRSTAVDACLMELDGRQVSWFSLDGGKHRGAIGTAEGQAMERAVRLAIDLGIPVVGRVASSGADVGEGIAALHAWGRVARAMVDASGVVPIILLLVGPAVSGPALLLGIADHVIMTNDAFAYVSGPDVVVSFTGVAIDRDRLGGAAVHERESGVATMVVANEDDALLVARFLLGYLPSNHLEDPPIEIGRRSRRPRLRTRRGRGAGARDGLVRRAHRHQRRARSRLVPRAARRRMRRT